MKIFENITPYICMAGDDSGRLYLERGRCKGQYSAKLGKLSASLKLSEEKLGELTVVRLKASVKGAKFSPDCAVALEIPSLGELDGLFANFQNCMHWCRSSFDTDLTKLHERTMSLLVKNAGGRYGYILPLVDDSYKTLIRGAQGGMELYTFANISDGDSFDQLICVYGEGDEPYKLMHDVAELALEKLANGTALRENRRYPEIFEYLGWCSWDALEIRVSTEGLLEKCEEIRAKNVPIRWAILDDMWAECDKLREIPDDLNRSTGMFAVMHSSKIRSFEADPKRFPTGLADCIRQMKEYGLKIGMWHPTSGYWAGIDPESELAKTYKDYLVTTENGRLMPSPEFEKAFGFYSAFHDFLKGCGTDFVKIDNQGFVKDNYRNILPIGKAARNIQRALASSVGGHFDNDIIECMCMAPENMFNRPTGAVARCSGDFQPENRAWFIRHILACSYNSLVQGMFYWGDWDMWWTDDEQAVKNSVLRAISGGPIYVSDKIGRTNPEILEPLAYSDGRILRCEAPAVPTLDCLVSDPEVNGRIFKVKNNYEVGGVIAAFNLDKEERPVVGTIDALELGICGKVALYEHFTGEVAILGEGEKLDVTLENHDDFKLYTIVPMKDGIAMLGLIDKFNSPMAVREVFDGVYDLHEGGRLAYVSETALAVTSDSGTYEPTSTGLLRVVELPLSDRHVKLG